MDPKKGDIPVKKSKTDILCEMDQERYERVITDVNGKVDDLFDALKKVDKKQVEVNKQIEEVDGNNFNFLENLRQHLNQSDQTITKLTSQLALANEEYNQQSEQLDVLEELAKKSENIEEKITEDIERLEKELKELILFYGKPDNVPKRMKDFKTQIEVQEAQHKERIDQIKNHFVDQQDILNQVFVSKLKDMSSKHPDQYEICTAGYSERKLNELMDKEKMSDKTDLADEKDLSNGKED